MNFIQKYFGKKLGYVVIANLVNVKSQITWQIFNYLPQNMLFKSNLIISELKLDIFTRYMSYV